MTSPTNPAAGRVPLERLNLEFPRSLGVYDRYEDAQRAVDFLSDHEFPVQNVMIVGTDLKQVERVTGRLTWGKVVAGGLLSGMWLGLFVGLIMSMFGSQATALTFTSALLTGAVFGIIWAGLGYSFTRGRRDFTSVSQVVATRYEVLVEHALYSRGRELLAQLPGGRSSAPAEPSSAATGAPTRPNPYEGRYGIRTDETPRTGAAGSSTGATAVSPGGDERREPEPRENPYEGRYGIRTDEAPPATDGERTSDRRDEPDHLPPDPRDGGR